jgi:hypothetical protein
MATININIETKETDVINVNVNGTQQESEQEKKEKINALHTKLRGMLNKYNSKRYESEKKHWWYEVFVDFDEDFDDAIYPIIKDMDISAAYTHCLGYMYMRDAYYFSPEYFEDLNEMVRNCKFKV